MSVMLATLVLNEMEWLEKLYDQHKDWPGLSKWMFVESADRMYQKANPSLVSPKGLSIDGTTDFLKKLAQDDKRIVHVPYGFSHSSDPAQGKVACRNVYLKEADEVRPDWIVVLDADEFYTKKDQSEVIRIAEKFRSVQKRFGFRFRQRHIWLPPSVQPPFDQEVKPETLFGQEVLGAYWAIPHTRVWRHYVGMRYRNNHNSPEGFFIKALENQPGMPQCVHMGFASSLRFRKAKHSYYVARGEGKRDKRQMYVDCRAAYETWRPGLQLPHGARVVSYDGPLPESFFQERNDEQ